MAILLMIAPMGAATAQDRATMMERLRSLEMQMQQLKTTHSPSTGAPYSQGGQAAAPSAATAAKMQLLMGEQEEAMRELRGRLEQQEYANQRQQRRLDQLERELDLRLQELEARIPVAAPVVDMPPAAPKPAPTIEALDETTEPPVTSGASAQGALELPTKEQQEPSANATYDNAKDLYNAAFALLNKDDYKQAGALFEQFTQRFTEDPLIGNAHYWLGEIHFVQRHYPLAADAFRKGFESRPNGPKTPDNLLRLGMTLSAMERKEEACLVLHELLTNHAEQSRVIARKAERERKELSCQ